MNVPLVVVRASRRSSSTDKIIISSSSSQQPAAAATAPPTRFDRLSLQNNSTHLMSIEECEKLIPQQERYDGDDSDHRTIRNGSALFLDGFGGAAQQQQLLVRKKNDKNKNEKTERDDEETESTEDCTHSNSNPEEDADPEEEHDRLWQRMVLVQQPSRTDEGQERLQAYWNLCYPTTTNPRKKNKEKASSSPANKNQAAPPQPSKSCLNKQRDRTTAAASPVPTTTTTTTIVPTTTTTPTSTPTELSPGRKKNHPDLGNANNTNNNNTTIPTAASSRHDGRTSASRRRRSLQFAPSSAVEFHEDAPVHEWRVLADAAQRFPTTGTTSASSSSDNDDDDETNAISESTWAALFALERETESTDRSQNWKEQEDDDDDESSLDGGLGRLAPCHGTLSSANQLQLSASSLLSSEDSDPSLQFTGPSPRSASNHINNSNPTVSATIPYAGFHEGFRMNSDQSLGLHSLASSNSDRSLSLAAPLRASFISSNNSNNNGNIASNSIPFAAFNDGFRMNSDQSLGIHSVASSSSDRSLYLVAPTRSSPTTNNNNAGNIPCAAFHEGFRMNSDQSLGVRSIASSSSSATTDDSRRVLSMTTMMAISTAATTTTKYSECYYPKQQGLRNLMAGLRDEETVEAARAASVLLSGGTTTTARHG